MFHSKSWKALSISATLISLMLVSALVGTLTETVRANPAAITLYAPLSTDPYYGWFAGYHDIMTAVKRELAKIDIDLQLSYWDISTIIDIVMFSNWDSYDTPPAGWDLSTGEDWMFPHGLLWCWATEPGAWANIQPYLNPKAVKLFETAEATIDPYERQTLLWKFQEVVMDDANLINFYYSETFDMRDKTFDGSDIPGLYWAGDFEHFRLDNASRIADRLPPGILRWGTEVGVTGSTNPIFHETYTSEALNLMTFDTLFVVDREPFPPTTTSYYYTPEGLELYPYVVSPSLATGITYSPDYKTANVTLTEGVRWIWPNSVSHPVVDGKPEYTGYNLTAEDVVLTYEAVLDPATMALGYADFAPIIESVEEIDEFTVQFNLKRPHADFELLLANTWGGNILPMRVPLEVGGDALKDIPHGVLRTHETNSFPERLPAHGPYYLDDYEKTTHVHVKKNPYYYGTLDPSLNEIQVVVVLNPPTRLIMLGTRELDLTEGLVGTRAEVEAVAEDGNHVGLELVRYSTNPLTFNLNNPKLANRYLRQAIAHSIPWKDIFEKVLPGWGIDPAPYFGTAYIFPWHTYTRLWEGENVTVSLFNPNLEPYEHNITKAQYYMDLYLNQTKAGETVGPVGDADQSGLVDLTDWGIWNTYIGTGVTTPIDIYPAWPYTVDPDFNNDGDVDIIIDEALWADPGYGTEYPSAG